MEFYFLQFHTGFYIAFLAPHLLKCAKVSPVELETHDAGSAGGKVWYCGIRDFNNPLTAEDTNSEFTLALSGPVS